MAFQFRTAEGAEIGASESSPARRSRRALWVRTFAIGTHWHHYLALPVTVMEIAAPLMDWLFAILAHEATGGLCASLLLRSRVMHAAWTAKVDGDPVAVAHANSPLESEIRVDRMSHKDDDAKQN
jgi:hypothetical protein